LLLPLLLRWRSICDATFRKIGSGLKRKVGGVWRR
jgi:hypothetical protein